MSTGLTQRSNSKDNKVRAKPLQPSTNIIHTKTPKGIGEVNLDLKSGRSLEVPDSNRLLKPLKSTSKGLSVRSNNNEQKFKKPLKTSTNIINGKINNKAPLGLKKVDENFLEKNLVTESREETSTTPFKSTLKVDENDVSAFVKNSYNPLEEVCPLDEELYQKILKLELADDGFPRFESDEPFDF